jgi:hypothetical protein
MMLIAVLTLASAASPISKVLQLLGELQQKVLKEGEAEQKQYEAFAEWCEDSAVAKQYEIKDGKAAKERFEATIAKEGATISTNEVKIADLASTISTNEADLKAATEIRDKEAADFAKADADLSETISMLARAAGIISKNMNGSFLQGDGASKLKDALQEIVTASALQTQDKAKIQSLLQSNKDDDDDFLQQPSGAPAAAGYESHSSGILDVLEDMKDKAQEMRHEGQQAEMTSKHNFELLAQSLKDAVKVDGEAMAEAKKNKATAEEAKALAEGELASTTKELANDQKDLADLSTDCQQKASDWSESQTSRAAELQALVDAKNIIEEKTGGGASRAYGLLQASEDSASTLQAGQDVVAKLRQVQKANGDVALAQLTFRVQAMLGDQVDADVFAKVKGLIQDMIEKLVADAAAEASHKAFCDKEMSESEAKIADHTSQIDKFTARKDKAVASIGKQTEEVATLQKELAEIAKLQVEMDKNRADEKEAFAAAKKDYQDGIEGLTMALQVLRDYYAAESADTALVQQPAVTTHAKASGAATGIIGLLEVAQSDFSKMLADAEVAEDAAQREYDKISQDNKVSTAMKQTAEKAKTKNIAELKRHVSELSSDIDGEQTELDAVNEYYDKLKPACVAKPEPYAERKKRREAEIAGLKEAMSILEGLGDDGEAFLAVRTVRRHA